MFECFPKKRPDLPHAYASIYAEYYKANREGRTSASGLSQKLESWLHKQIAGDISKRSGNKGATLELGAGTLNQLPYENNVKPYDIVEPFSYLYQGSRHLKNIRNIYADIAEVPESNRYDRITSVATLEHICNLPEVLAKSAILLNEHGSFRASIPNEGTLVWTLGWKLTTGFEFKLRYGLDYGMIMKYEHVNTADEIEFVLNYFFDFVECRFFGISKQLAVYRFYECRSPVIERCLRFTPANKTNE